MADSKYKRDERSQINKEQRDSYEVDEMGTRLPCATPMGGSRGFNAQETIPIHVDPEYPEGFIFDPKNMKGGKPVRLPGETAESLIRQDVEKPEAVSVEEGTVEAVSEALTCPRELNTERLETKEQIRVAAAMDVAERQSRSAAVQLAAAPPLAAPDKKIVFDFGAPFGKMTTYYHNISRDGTLLILLWDSRYKQGTKFEPAVTEAPLKVFVGAEGEEHYILSTGLVFSLPEYHLELIVLLICDEAVAKMSEENPGEQT